MLYAPIVIPTLCRSTHFIRLMESLKKNTWACYTDVYIGLDFPPNEKYESGWREICEYLNKSDFSALNKVTVIRRNANLGAIKNSEELIQYVQERYDRWIYAEDDCEFSPNFLEYMDKCLDEYESDESIVAVTGYSYPVDWVVNENATCFLQNFNVAMWGAGFWRDKYKFAADFIYGGKLLDAIGDCAKNHFYERMIDASFVEYVKAALSNRKSELMIRPTDVALRAYMAVNNKYCISPVLSKVRNYGFDGTGCYCKSKNDAADCFAAQKYDYEKQFIDASKNIEICLDCNLEHMEVNRARLNTFDSRQSKEVLYVRHLIWMVNHFGLKWTKMYHCMRSFLGKMRKII